MYTNQVTEHDFCRMTWGEFEFYTKKIASNISIFCKNEGVNIDFICPIIRGGSVLAVYLSHLLGVIPCIGIQFKHLSYENTYESPKLIFESLSYFSEKKRMEHEYTVLLVEGNHCSGNTALEACRLLRRNFPQIKIIYASLARDYAHRDTVSGVIFSTTGYYSNESNENYTPEFIAEHEIKEKYTLFPWELIQEEIDECNHIPIKTASGCVCYCCKFTAPIKHIQYSFCQ